MPNLPTRLARKWQMRCNHLPPYDVRGAIPGSLCVDCVVAACREVLEEVNKEWVNRLSVYNADKAIPLEGIAAALRALREGE